MTRFLLKETANQIQSLLSSVESAVDAIDEQTSQIRLVTFIWPWVHHTVYRLGDLLLSYAAFVLLGNSKRCLKSMLFFLIQTGLLRLRRMLPSKLYRALLLKDISGAGEDENIGRRKKVVLRICGFAQFFFFFLQKPRGKRGKPIKSISKSTNWIWCGKQELKCHRTPQSIELLDQNSKWLPWKWGEIRSLHQETFSPPYSKLKKGSRKSQRKQLIRSFNPFESCQIRDFIKIFWQ